ncbi:MAG: YicC family protein [Sphaerochaetaceae bacterium]|nr:YicC family protein [Sphaerochaetaceae bacterium]
MKSMTGYGYMCQSNDNFFLEVEVKSYNNRYLEIQHNISYLLSSFESLIDKKVSKVASRGKVEVFCRLKVLENNMDLNVDKEAVRKYSDAFKDIEDIAGYPIKLSATDFLSIEGIVTSTSERNPELYRESLEACLDGALKMFEEAKLREGEGTRKDLERLGLAFQECNDRIAEKISSIEDYFKNLLMTKYNELLDSSKVDQDRLLQEVGTLLVKYSINEEQNRLKTHLKEYFRLLSSNEPVGKRLDFLCQEMNREVNTTASKSQLAEINLETVKMKDHLENIREQIRNIE